MSGKINIFMVDDDNDDYDLLVLALSQIRVPGYELRRAREAEELFDLLLKRGEYRNSGHPMPDLIILDLNMPMQGGIEILKELKSIDKLKSIPVFILTTSDNSYDKSSADVFGSAGYYRKPNTLEGLKDTLSDMLFKATQRF